MHGYFIDNRLYQKAKSAANPFAHEEFVAKQIEKDIDEEAKRKPIKKKVKYPIRPESFRSKDGLLSINDPHFRMIFGTLVSNKARKIIFIF